MDTELSKKAEEVSGVLKQLAHPGRLRVLCCLQDGEKTVSELVEYTELGQSFVSQILTRMKSDGLVESRKEGKFVFYQIADVRLKSLMHGIYESYCKPSKTKRSPL